MTTRTLYDPLAESPTVKFMRRLNFDPETISADEWLRISSDFERFAVNLDNLRKQRPPAVPYTAFLAGWLFGRDAGFTLRNK